MEDISKRECCKCWCAWHTTREPKSEDVEPTSGGASSLMWNAVGGEMEEDAVNAVKVRCDQDDVSGVALDIERGRELESELEKIMMDDDDDKSGNDNINKGGLSCMETDSRGHGNSADGRELATDGFVDANSDAATLKDVDASMTTSTPNEIDAVLATPKSSEMDASSTTSTSTEMDASFVTPTLTKDDKGAAWVNFFCSEPEPVNLKALGIADLRRYTHSYKDLLQLAYKAEESANIEALVMPSTLSRADIMRFYSANVCRCASIPGQEPSICGYCASRYRKRAREEMKERKVETKMRKVEGKEKGVMDGVRKTLFVGDGDDSEYDWCGEEY